MQVPPTSGPAPAEGRAVLYLGIMVHLEGWSDDMDRARFNDHAALVREYADLFERYGARLTPESKEFTDGCLRWGDNVLLENGRLVLLPSSGELACMQEEAGSPATPGTRCVFTQEDIDAFRRQLEEALTYAEPDRVNIYYVSWSLGSPLDTTLPERWLQSIQPYVQSGRVEWMTLPEMYEEYIRWEQTH